MQEQELQLSHGAGSWQNSLCGWRVALVTFVSAALVLGTLGMGVNASQAQARPVAKPIKVTAPKWRTWVFDRMVEHREDLVGRTALITMQLKSDQGDETYEMQYDPASGALYATYRSSLAFHSPGYGYTVACTSHTVCWYIYEGSLGGGRWVDVKPGHVKVRPLVTHPNDLTLRISSRSTVTKSMGVRHGIGSETDFPTDKTTDVLRVLPGAISYRWFERYLTGKGKVGAWKDVTWTSRVGPPASEFVVPAPTPDEVVSAPWAPWGTRIVYFEQF